MKQVYIKPHAEVIELEIGSMMMVQSKVDTGIGDIPSEPDAPGHRGEWGNLWKDSEERRYGSRGYSW